MVTVGNVVKVFRNVNMQTTPVLFTASRSISRPASGTVNARERRYVLPPDTARLLLSSPINLTGEADVFFYTFLQLFDALLRSVVSKQVIARRPTFKNGRAMWRATRRYRLERHGDR